MVFKNKKFGFSLVELMIFFLFITILIAASTPIITKRIKNIPMRAYHGKFLCYRKVEKDDSGNIVGSKLIGEYYNSTGKLIRKVESDSETTLEFVPPKRASIYKVDMIGAGAGGYDFVNYANETDPYHEATFNKYGDGNFYGDFIYKLKDSDIEQRLQGVLNTIVAWTGRGGDGGSIRYAHPVPSHATSDRSLNCVDRENDIPLCYHYGDALDQNVAYRWNTPGEGNINTKEIIEPKIPIFNLWLLENYPDTTGDVVELGKDDEHTNKEQLLQYTITQSVQDSIQNKLNEMLLGTLLPIPVSDQRTVYGGRGGKGTYISYTYKVDFNSPEAAGKSAAEYIKYLMKRYVSGWSPHRAGELGFKFNTGFTPNGADGKDGQASISNPSVVATGGAGGNAKGYGAIKYDDNKYITNYQLATGAGETAMRVLEDAGRLKLTYSDGFNADSNGLIDSDGKMYDGSKSSDGLGPSFSSDGSKDIKYVELISTVPTRTYYIGASGSSATPVTKTFTALSDKCTITIPPLSQSDVIHEDTEIVPTLNTEFTCQGWKKPVVALSATPLKYCTVDSRTAAACNATDVKFPIFNPYQTYSGGSFDDSGFVSLPEFYEVVAQTAANTLFGAISNIFSRGPKLDKYGVGGDGTGYKDKCLEMGGSINIYTKNSSGAIVSKSNTINFPYDPSCKMSNNEKKPATAGSPGAVIISW